MKILTHKELKRLQALIIKINTSNNIREVCSNDDNSVSLEAFYAIDACTAEMAKILCGYDIMKNILEFNEKYLEMCQEYQYNMEFKNNCEVNKDE